MSGAVMRNVIEIHRVLVGCPCGAQFSLPNDAQAHHVCRCNRVYEHGWRSEWDHERFLAIHDRETWEHLKGSR